MGVSTSRELDFRILAYHVCRAWLANRCCGNCNLHRPARYTNDSRIPLTSGEGCVTQAYLGESNGIENRNFKLPQVFEIFRDIQLWLMVILTILVCPHLIFQECN